MVKSTLVLLSMLLCIAAMARAQDDAGVRAWRPVPLARHREDDPRLLTSAERCTTLLRATRARDLVHPQRAQVGAPDGPMEGVAFPVRLTSTLFSVVVGAHGGHRRPRPIAGDCRLFLAIAHWSRSLHEAGITRIGHLSLHRPGRCGEPPSGHCAGLAIDVAHFVFEDGTDFDVGHDWVDRTHGASPCGDRPAESGPMTTVRRLVCASSDGAMFNVVLTPHYDDDHQNHVHLEVRPDMTGLVLH